MERIINVVFEEKIIADDDVSVFVFNFTDMKLARECFEMCADKIKENCHDDNYDEGYTVITCFNTGSCAYIWEQTVDSNDFRKELA